MQHFLKIYVNMFSKICANPWKKTLQDLKKHGKILKKTWQDSRDQTIPRDLSFPLATKEPNSSPVLVYVPPTPLEQAASIYFLSTANALTMRIDIY